MVGCWVGDFSASKAMPSSDKARAYGVVQGPSSLRIGSWGI